MWLWRPDAVDDQIVPNLVVVRNPHLDEAFGDSDEAEAQERVVVGVLEVEEEGARVAWGEGVWG